jgi:hypothetical protein
LDRFLQDPVGFFNPLVTIDETWIYIYHPETKEQCEERRHRGSPSPKKFKTQNTSSKVLASVFWNRDGILLVEYLEKGATITAQHYVALVGKLKQELVSKHRAKTSKGILFLEANAVAHKAAINR